ncbi:hypothetical protein QBC34DRAFT_10438 [Podospora aff. communis PSN243]|uniref:Uncharacterized protein n=1 Tax=Podospora aff. communis PSN243 TaxID=3040156 RepID=A0AAV9H896_9PEZI|nr:hypothetical protein QBC34DRAFT_10438 [Podospora aff. communis PSN243]
MAEGAIAQCLVSPRIPILRAYHHEVACWSLFEKRLEQHQHAACVHMRKNTQQQRHSSPFPPACVQARRVASKQAGDMQAITMARPHPFQVTAARAGQQGKKPSQGNRKRASVRKRAARMRSFALLTTPPFFLDFDLAAPLPAEPWPMLQPAFAFARHGDSKNGRQAKRKSCAISQWAAALSLGRGARERAVAISVCFVSKSLQINRHGERQQKKKKNTTSFAPVRWHDGDVTVVSGVSFSHLSEESHREEDHKKKVNAPPGPHSNWPAGLLFFSCASPTPFA